MTRWLFCLTDGYGSRGGIAQYNRDLIAHLAALRPDDEIHVIQRGGAPVADMPAAVHWHAPCQGRLRYVMAVVWLLWRLRPRVFCGHLYMAPLLAPLARLLGLRWWLQLHGIEVWQAPPAACLRAAARADVVTTVSRHTRRECLARVPLPAWRVRVLPNTGHALPAASQPVARRPHQLLTVTRLSAAERYKGVDRVLDVLPMLRADFPELRYVIAGEGDDSPRLQAQAARLGLSDLVRFEGHVDMARREHLLRESGVFVMASTGEGFGIAFLEAVVAGCHVVAGNRDGSVDALGEGRAGLLVDPDDAPALSLALRHAMSIAVPAGRGEQALERFGPVTVRAALAELLRELERG